MTYAEKIENIMESAAYVSKIVEQYQQLVDDMQNAIALHGGRCTSERWPLRQAALEWVGCGWTAAMAKPWWDAQCWCPLATTKMRNAGVDPSTAGLLYQGTDTTLGRQCCLGRLSVSDMVNACSSEL
jgi:hypothetical protein